MILQFPTVGGAHKLYSIYKACRYTLIPHNVKNQTNQDISTNHKPIGTKRKSKGKEKKTLMIQIPTSQGPKARYQPPSIENVPQSHKIQQGNFHISYFVFSYSQLLAPPINAAAAAASSNTDDSRACASDELDDALEGLLPLLPTAPAALSWVNSKRGFSAQAQPPRTSANRQLSHAASCARRRIPRRSPGVRVRGGDDGGCRGGWYRHTPWGFGPWGGRRRGLAGSRWRRRRRKKIQHLHIYLCRYATESLTT